MIFARLDKTGWKVLCGRQNERGHYQCRGSLLKVGVRPAFQTVERDGVEIEVRDEERDVRYINIPPGWKVRDDGVLVPTQHAVRRHQKKSWAATGNPNALWSLTPADRERLRHSDPYRYRRPTAALDLDAGVLRDLMRDEANEFGDAIYDPLDDDSMLLQVSRPATLPVDVLCLECRGVNRLDPGRLGVVSTP